MVIDSPASRSFRKLSPSGATSELRGTPGAVAVKVTALGRPVDVQSLGAPEAQQANGWAKFLGTPYPTVSAWKTRTAEISRRLEEVKIPEGARQVMNQMAELGMSSVDLWHGSHAVVRHDQGTLQQAWQKLAGSPRSSSHYPGVHSPQFQVDFGDGALLFGKNLSGDTWFQLENHGLPSSPVEMLKHPWITLMHLIDYGRFRLTGQNVGPLGLSPHREASDPLVLHWKPQAAAP